MDFRVLGPFEVVDRHGPLRIGGPKERALLALLVLHRGEAVSSERLVDELWGEHPPPTAVKTLQVYVSHVRKALGGELLRTRGHGYLLELEPEHLDLERFERLAAEGSRALADGDAALAARKLRGALVLWRGPPLADFAYASFAQSEIARLEELRLACLEERIEADLALGRHAALVPELEGLVRRHTLRERVREQLMRALYACGRQADALSAYQDARLTLTEELGLAPGRGLRELERKILEQAPELDPPARRPGVVGPFTRAPARPAPLLVATGCVVAAVVIAVVVLRLARGGEEAARVTLHAGSVGLIDPNTGRLARAVAVPGGPARIAVAGGTAWVGADRSHSVSAIDPRGAISKVVPTGGEPTDLAFASGSIWVLDRRTGTVTQVSVAHGAVVRRTRLPGALVASTASDRSTGFAPWSIAAGSGSVWITDGSTRLRQIDARSGRRVATFALGRPLNGVAVGHGKVWAISGSTSTVMAFDPRRRAIDARIQIVDRPGSSSPAPIAVETGLGSVWVLNARTRTVTRIDPRQRGVAATIPVGVEHMPVRLAVGHGAVWVAGADGILTRIDARTAVLRRFAVAGGLSDVAVAPAGVLATASRSVRERR